MMKFTAFPLGWKKRFEGILFLGVNCPQFCKLEFKKRTKKIEEEGEGRGGKWEVGRGRGGVGVGRGGEGNTQNANTQHAHATTHNITRKQQCATTQDKRTPRTHTLTTRAQITH